MNPFYLLFLSAGLALAATPIRRGQGEQPGCPVAAGGCSGWCQNGLCMTTGGVGFPCGSFNGFASTCIGYDGRWCKAYGDGSTECIINPPTSTPTPGPTPRPKGGRSPN